MVNMKLSGKDKIDSLIKASKKIILDSCLENGAIVAANLDKPYFPKNVYFYRYVWPRDVAFTLAALDILGIGGVHEKYYKWLIERAEEFNKTGILYQNYHTHGPKHHMNLQPDSNGLTLWAIYYHAKHTGKKPPEKLVKKLADGICSVWGGKLFRVETQDPWEERIAYPELDELHVYSAAMACNGLMCANKMHNNKKWNKTALQMKKEVLASYDKAGKHFPRTRSSIRSHVNHGIDASLLGLTYPAKIVTSNDPRMVSTVKDIEKRLNKEGGILRYEFDLYDGMIQENNLMKKGAGCWPLLNFWMSIYYSIRGDRKKAMEYYMWVIDRIDDDLIPEQIFDNNIQSSITPLVWSHSMFIIASRFLGFV